MQQQTFILFLLQHNIPVISTHSVKEPSLFVAVVKFSMKPAINPVDLEGY